MRILIQRVKEASVAVDHKKVAEIGPGLLLLVGIGKEDSEEDLEKLAKKVLGLRIFSDREGKMNLDITQTKGELLSVPQFTLFADTRRGNRPGFEGAAAPETARELWKHFNQLLKGAGATLREGVFGAMMKVSLVNDGPVTLMLDSKEK